MIVNSLTFQRWHEAAGYSLSWMARCDARYFRMLYSAWLAADSPQDWSGAAKVLDPQPWS